MTGPRPRFSRDFAAYHDFLRASRNVMEHQVVAQTYHAYRESLSLNGATTPRDFHDALGVLDGLPQFQLYAWMYRRLQQFKYHVAPHGLEPALETQRAALEASLSEAARVHSERLRLNPALPLPDYYTAVDFHQQRGGVWRDDLDGLVYELARLTTLPAHLDPNLIYRLVFAALPKDRRFANVLDWGCGHGAGLLTWMEDHPETLDAQGVDLSAPCLRLAHARALEAGRKAVWSQQDIASLDFEDNRFDLAFHLFMWHEIAPAHHERAFREVWRVLKPGGIFIGPEFGYDPQDPFSGAMMVTHSYANNETYSVPTYLRDFEALARHVGFSRVSSTPFVALNRKNAVDPQTPPLYDWQLYLFEK